VPIAPQQQRGRDTRAALLQAGRCAFEELGWEATTVRAITSRAGTATGTFYRYFPDSDALLFELATARYARLRAGLRLGVEPDPDEPAGRAERIAARVRANFAWVLAYHTESARLHSIIEQRRPFDPRLDALGRAVDGAIVADTVGLLRSWGASDAEAPEVAFVMLSLFESCAAQLAAGVPFAPDVVASVCVDMVTRHLLGSPP